MEKGIGIILLLLVPRVYSSYPEQPGPARAFLRTNLGIPALPPTKATQERAYALKKESLQARINSIQADLNAIAKQGTEYIGQEETLNAELVKTQNHITELDAWFQSLPEILE